MNQKIKEKTYRTKSEIYDFFKEQGVKYLKRSRIAWPPLLALNLEKSEYYQSNITEFKKLDKKYYHDIENSRIAPIYIKKIDKTLGFGVFADSPIKKNAFIGEYAGVIQPSDEDSGCELCNGGYESDYSWYYLDDIKNAPTLEINGRLEGNEMRFVNHSSTPNVEVEHTLHKGQWILFFKAKQNIRKDEQLFISYGEYYWDDGCRALMDI